MLRCHDHCLVLGQSIGVMVLSFFILSTGVLGFHVLRFCCLAIFYFNNSLLATLPAFSLIAIDPALSHYGELSAFISLTKVCNSYHRSRLAILNHNHDRVYLHYFF